MEVSPLALFLVTIFVRLEFDPPIALRAVRHPCCSVISNAQGPQVFFILDHYSQVSERLRREAGVYRILNCLLEDAFRMVGVVVLVGFHEAVGGSSHPPWFLSRPWLTHTGPLLAYSAVTGKHWNPRVANLSSSLL